MIKKIGIFMAIVSVVTISLSIWGAAIEIESLGKNVFWIWIIVPVLLILIIYWAIFRPLAINKYMYLIVVSLILIIIGIGYITYFIFDKTQLPPIRFFRMYSNLIFFIAGLGIYTKLLNE